MFDGRRENNLCKYQSYREFEKIIGRLPRSLIDSISIIIRRAEQKIEKSQISFQGELDGLNEFREQVGTWFSRILKREELLFENKTSIISFLTGISIVLVLNIDTFSIVNWLSTTSTQTQNGKQIEMAFPIAWQPRTVSRQFNCPLLSNQKSVTLPDLQHCFSTSPNSSVSVILGWLVSSMAISLGAPFWLSLISQLKNIAK